MLGILAVHTTFQFQITYFYSVALAGQYCVPFFFAISAYLTFRSLDKTQDSWTVQSYFKYLFHKLIRFLPVLYIAVLWQFLAYCGEIGRIPAIHDDFWKNAFFAITFLNGFSYQHINPWGNWYVGVLWQFIILAPLIRRFVDSPKKAVILFVVSVCIGWLSTWILTSFGMDSGGYFYFWFPRQFPALAFGIVFYYLETYKDKEAVKNSYYTLLFIIIVGILWSMCWLSMMELHVRYGVLLFVFSYILFNRRIVLKQTEYTPPRVYEPQDDKLFAWLKVLGDNSYGIYLYQAGTLPIVGNCIYKLGFAEHPHAAFALCYIVSLFLCLGISAIVHVLLEKPFFAYMKKKFAV